MSFSPFHYTQKTDDNTPMVVDPTQFALPPSTSVSPNDSSYGFMSTASTPLFPSPDATQVLDSAGAGTWSIPLPDGGAWAMDHLQNPPMSAPVPEHGIMMPPTSMSGPPMFSIPQDGWASLPSAPPVPSSGFSGLTPLDTHFMGQTSVFPVFGTQSPSDYTMPPQASPEHNPLMQARPGPVRHHSTSMLHSRRRSSTLMTLASATSQSPSTPQWSEISQPYPTPQVDPSASFNRRTSMPIFHHLTRRYHPAPAGTLMPSTSIDIPYLQEDSHVSPRYPQHAMPEAKPPRFKPTKEQLEILIASYNMNKNPDGPAREELAKRLGPDIKPKTLQIWFQNRRSKSRAKERDAALPKPLSFRDRPDSPRLGLGGRPVDMEALRLLTRETGVELTILPISVLSISTWTRFLTPGSAMPDLACALSSTTLLFYVLHQGETFRIAIPLGPTSMYNLMAASNLNSNADAVAVRFDLEGGVARFGCWAEQDGWRDAGDFTSGAAGRGGRVEITGQRAVLLPAFGSVQQRLLLAENTAPADTLVDPNAAHPKFEPALPLSKWTYPSNPVTDGLSVVPLSADPHSSLQSRVRSFSAPIQPGMAASLPEGSASLLWADLGLTPPPTSNWHVDGTAELTPKSAVHDNPAWTPATGAGYGQAPSTATDIEQSRPRGSGSMEILPFVLEGMSQDG